MELAGLTDRVIGAAIAVHRELGPGFLESIYENALAVELQSIGLEIRQQVTVPVIYRDVEVGTHRLDLLVDGCLIVELKVIRDFEPIHFSIVRSYMHAMKLQHGLLLNFAKTRLEPKRVIAKQSR